MPTRAKIFTDAKSAAANSTGAKHDPAKHDVAKHNAATATATKRADANFTDVNSAAAAKSIADASSPAAAPALIEATAMGDPKTPRRARSKRFRRDRIRYAAVGEDITAPALLASAGRLRIRSERAAQVARWFGLRKADDPEPAGEGEHAGDGNGNRDGGGGDRSGATSDTVALPELLPGTITFIGGPSGAGKSSLLRAARERFVAAARPWIDLAELSPPEVPLVDCFGDALALRDVLLLLARVGLGEAWSYLRTPAELSEGQRWRLKVALGLHAAAAHVAAGRAPVLACDEFAALLDRVTALVVARQLRRAVDALPGAAVVVATSHDDLQPALRPDVIAWCDFGVVEMVETRWSAERRAK